MVQHRTVCPVLKNQMDTELGNALKQANIKEQAKSDQLFVNMLNLPKSELGRVCEGCTL